MTEPLKRHQRISGEPRQKLQAEMVDKYGQGVAIRTLAAEYGRSYGFIHRLLLDAGVEFRARGGNNNRGLTKAQRAEYDARLRAKK